MQALPCVGLCREISRGALLSMLPDAWISPDKYANKSLRSGRRTTGTFAAYVQCIQSSMPVSAMTQTHAVTHHATSVTIGHIDAQWGLGPNNTHARTQKVKPIWILLKQETVSGSGISWAICKSAPRSRQITKPAPPLLSFFTGWMPFLPPNQQHQSTEGTNNIT